MAIDFQILQTIFSECAGRVHYKLGAKASLQASPSSIKAIDCSGWFRYHIFHATGQTWPDGSQAQLAFARQHLRKLNKYSDVHFAAQDPKRLFVGFLSPKPNSQWPRHVWEIYKGRTMESCSSLGVGSRAWDVGALRNCKECFEIV